MSRHGSLPVAPAAAAIVAALALAGCSDNGNGAVQGYVEGTYVYVSPDDAGRIVERPVTAGETVAAGDVLAKLDELRGARGGGGRRGAARPGRGQLANLRSGKRPVEISVIEAQLSEARANFDLAEQEYQRQLVLREKDVVSQSAVDDRQGHAAMRRRRACGRSNTSSRWRSCRRGRRRSRRPSETSRPRRRRWPRRRSRSNAGP